MFHLCGGGKGKFMTYYKIVTGLICTILIACTPLPKIASDGDVEKIRSITQSNADLEVYADQNTTALYEAVTAGHKEIVELLLRAGANPDAADLDDGWTPLIVAAKLGYSSIADLLIRNKANVNVTNSARENALMHAAYQEHLSIVEMLIDAGAELDAVNDQGMTALMMSLGKYGNAEIAIKLIKAGSDVNRTDMKGWTPLAMAVRNGHKAAVKELLKYKAVINNKNSDGWTPLMLTAAQGAGYTDIAEILLAGAPNKNEVNKNKNTALMIAVENKHFKLAKLLVNKGANINISNEFGNTALSIASGNSDLSYTKLLVSKGANIEHANNQGDTPLLIAANNGNRSVIEYLVNKGASYNVVNRSGKDVFAMANTKSIGDILAGLLTNLKKSEYKKNQKCSLKIKGWYYLGDSCQNGLAHGEGRSINLDTNSEFIGMHKKGYIDNGKLEMLNAHVFTGPHNRRAEAHGEGICYYKGDPERCEFYEGKRMDSLYKQRLAMQKQESILQNQKLELEKMKNEMAKNQAAQQSLQAKQQQPEKVSEECMNLGLALIACDQGPSGPFGVIRTGCKSLAESNFPCSIPLNKLLLLVR